MTLVQAVESLALIELTAVSCIHVVPYRSSHVAFFSIAFLLPFLDPELSDEFVAGETRFWPDQARLLQSDVPIEHQILELAKTRLLGTISQIYFRPRRAVERELWLIDTHCGTERERLTWMKAVIDFEGRSPWRGAKVVQVLQPTLPVLLNGPRLETNTAASVFKAALDYE